MSLISDLLKRLPPRKRNSLEYIVYRATRCRHIYVPDKQLHPVTWQWIETLYHFFSKEFKPIQSEWYDCDDQARNFWNYAKNHTLRIKGRNGAIGYLWTNTHALCLFIDENYKVNYIETYTGKPTAPDSRVRFVIF